MQMKTRGIRSIAMIEPLGDYGIGGYAYELSEGLVANGVRVDMYTQRGYPLARLPLPRRHRLLPVLGAFAFRQKDLFRTGPNSNVAATAADATPLPTSPRRLKSKVPLYSRLRNVLLPVELAMHMKRSKYDLVWTQFSLPTPYGARFLRLCRLFGTRVAHTVHNVLPHEPRPEHVQEFGAIYRNSDFLIVHSEAAKVSLLNLFPGIKAKIITAPLGLHTMFPRVPDSRKRVRERLGVRDDQASLLFFGAVRPYKNIDAVLEAMQSPVLKDAVLIVAGRESGYDDLVPGDPLGRTRKKAEELRIAGKLRLLPGLLDIQGTAEIFEAADIVLLPYTESYGSALLLLAMTFGKFILATPKGGMEEHLAHYSRYALIEDAGPSSIAGGINKILNRVLLDGFAGGPVRIPELEWPAIAKRILDAIAAES